MDVTEIIKGRGSGLKGNRAIDFLERRIKERGIIKKRYQIALRNDRAIWKRIIRAKIQPNMSVAEDAGRSYDAVILIGSKIDIDLFKANLKKQGVIVRGNAFVLK